jgi:predicted CoA-binding protein
VTESTVIEELLANSRVIAVVGLSDRPERPSHGVARYLQEQGYRIIPVNPKLTGPVLGEQPYPRLDDVPERVDLVDIFRRSIDVPPVVDAAIRIGAPAVWMQLGIVHEEAARRASAAGLQVVMDKCTAIEHRVLVRAGRLANQA